MANGNVIDAFLWSFNLQVFPWLESWTQFSNIVHELHNRSYEGLQYQQRQ